MEKRVKRRPETRDDPLRKLWSAIIADKDKLAAWSRKMKTRKHYEHNEITMEVIEEEPAAETSDKSDDEPPKQAMV